MKLSSYLQWINGCSFLLRLAFPAFAVWASVAAAQTPVTLGVQLYAGLSITGKVGQVYHIEYAVSLTEPADWIPLDYLVLARSPYLYIDTRVAASGRRFYRTRESAVLPVGEMAYIPPGTFMMGSPLSEAERRSDETEHQVTLTRGFWMGKYEVTQGEYLDVLGSNPSYFRNGRAPFSPGNGGAVTNELRHPVESVSWFDATNYCGKLTAREVGAGRIPAGWGYRLPTEAEWEYACRGGTTAAFHYGVALREGMANFNIRYEYDSTVGTITTSKKPLGRTSDVGSYASNAYGLYDMHGNVWEWCQDWYGPYPGIATDPVGPNIGSYHVFRGGSWGYGGRYCRSAFRYDYYPDGGSIIIGFRVVLGLGQ